MLFLRIVGTTQEDDMARDARAATRPPTERRNRDDAVMAAAIEVMSARGYSATSIQDVADRVGVLKGSLYHYFSSKEELLFRIVEESHKQTSRIAEEVATMGLSPLEELLEYLRRSSIWYLENRDRANIFFTDRQHLTGDRLAESNEWGRFFERHIQALVAAGQANGEIRPDVELRLITRFLLGAVNNVRFWPSRSGKAFGVLEISEALVALTRSAVATAPAVIPK
ncbi:transcriptional regulator, TetR family [Geodermatophilus africanus]|uniref:Transcriptional regulator, TetR family n=1 Tax=Geodermatophilus africanus TaxID=1137993 RepID=A0A1H3PK49_9ACTN|nr:TetR/AcrR family transcriptional regulator [Geodermatophilus africanus]SDZ01476.1 transcriptional regulator, TetR family [Geodermatophilus africanus]